MTSTVKDALRAQEARLLEAMRQRDLATLSDLFDREYVCTNGSGMVWGRERALRDLADPGTSFARLDVEVERVVPLQEAGVVTGRSWVEGEAGGMSVSGVYRFTRVWRRVNGEWRILATHTSGQAASE